MLNSVHPKTLCHCVTEIAHLITAMEKSFNDSCFIQVTINIYTHWITCMAEQKHGSLLNKAFKIGFNSDYSLTLATHVINKSRNFLHHKRTSQCSLYFTTFWFVCIKKNQPTCKAERITQDSTWKQWGNTHTLSSNHTGLPFAALYSRRTWRKSYDSCSHLLKVTKPILS